MRKVRKVKNVLPLLNLDYRSKIFLRRWQDNDVVPLGRGNARYIITNFGDLEIDRTVILGNILYIYVK